MQKRPPKYKKPYKIGPEVIKMWYNLLKSGKKQAAYRAFRNSIIHRGKLVLTPKDPEFIPPSTVKFSTSNDSFYFIYKPLGVGILEIKSDRPEYAPYTEYIAMAFQDEYPEMTNEILQMGGNIYLRETMGGINHKKEETAQRQKRDRLKLITRKIRIILDRFIIITMREILRPGSGISAAYRKQITTNLTDALPSHKDVFSKIRDHPDYTIEGILRAFQRDFRKNLMKTPYTMEHIINLFVNFKKNFLYETQPERGLSPESYFKRQYADIVDLQKQEIDEIIYSAIEENPQDTELFVNNLP